MFSRIRMEGYQTLDGRSKSFAIGKTSKPPARRSRARGFVAFFIAAETYYNSGARLLQFVCRTETENWTFTSKKRGAPDSLVKDPLDWISRSRTAQSRKMNCKK